MAEPSIDGGFQGLRYLSALLHIAKNSGMLEKSTAFSTKNKKNFATATSATASTSAVSPVEEISHPRPGAILIAHPCLPDWFSRTVVLLCDHTPTSTLGLCLNKPWGGDVVDLVQQGRKAGAGNLGINLSNSSTISISSHSEGSLSMEEESFQQEATMKPVILGGGRKKKKNRNRTTPRMRSIRTDPRLRIKDTLPLENAIVLNEINEEGNSSSDDDGNSNREIELIEETEDDFSSDFSDIDETDLEERSRQLKSLLKAKENEEEEEEEEEDDEEEQRRERLFEAINLLSSPTPSLGNLFNLNTIPNEEGLELVFETEDEETMELIAAAANALTDEWEKRGGTPGSTSGSTDISVLSKEAMTAIDQLVNGPQKEALMAMLNALETTHRQLLSSEVSTDQQQVEQQQGSLEEKSSFLLPFALPPPEEDENEDITASSVLRIRGGRATFSAGGREKLHKGKRGVSGGSGGGDDDDKNIIIDAHIDSPITRIKHSLLSQQHKQQQSPSFITPKELMAMTPRSQIYLGGPIPGVNVLHTHGSTHGSTILGGKAVLGIDNTGDTSSSSDIEHRVVMFGTEATAPQAAAALAPAPAPEEKTESQSKAVISAEQLKFYLGSSLWAPNQLQQELERGSWTMVQLDPSQAVQVFEAISGGSSGSGGGGGSESGVDHKNKINPSEAQEEAWQRVLGMISPAHAALAAVPDSAWAELQVLDI